MLFRTHPLRPLLRILHKPNARKHEDIVPRKCATSVHNSYVLRRATEITFDMLSFNVQYTLIFDVHTVQANT